MSSTARYKKVTTRKAHECFSCCQTSPAGTAMYSWAGEYEGDFNHGYTCIDCDTIITLYLKQYPEDGAVEYGFVRQWIDETGKTKAEIIAELNKRKGATLASGPSG